MKNLIITVFALLIVSIPFTPGACVESTFYLKANIGASQPFLSNLSDELVRQGKERVKPGYAFSVALGRSFLEKRWAVDACFTMVFYPGFDYENEHEDFVGDLRHYGYYLVVKRCFRPEGERFIPYAGVGLGYGMTNLLSGGGRIGAFEGLATFQAESVLKDNISIMFESVFALGFQEKRFEKPFLENVREDVIRTSGNGLLEDRYSAFDIRLGIIIRLKPPVDY